MITREGMETALLMGTLLFQMQGLDIAAGAVAGVAAAGVALLWSRYGHRVNLARVLSGHRRIPGGVRGAAVHLRVPRAHRGERAAL